MQLLLYKAGKPVRAKDVLADMRGSANQTQTFFRAAKACKGLRHIPFRRWIEESHLVALSDCLQRNDLHSVGIEKDIRIAAMIDVLQMLRLQHNVFINIHLNG
jgi:hypothetical protein